MRPVQRARTARILTFLIVLVSIASVGALAGDEGRHYWVSHDPGLGYAVPIQHVYQFPSPLVFQPTARAGYAIPIQHVYQFPAVHVFQPGSEVPINPSAGALYDQFGGPSFMPR